MNTANATKGSRDTAATRFQCAVSKCKQHISNHLPLLVKVNSAIYMRARCYHAKFTMTLPHTKQCRLTSNSTLTHQGDASN
eukprot:1194877-Prorocentrum_minimum.AAC.3